MLTYSFPSFGIVIITVFPCIVAVTTTFLLFSSVTSFLATPSSIVPFSKDILFNLYVITLFSVVLVFVTFNFKV